MLKSVIKSYILHLNPLMEQKLIKKIIKITNKQKQLHKFYSNKKVIISISLEIIKLKK